MNKFFYLDSLNQKQKEAVETLTGPVLILAGAGTGKTRVLTTRLSHILNKKLAKPWEILAVTFTNKAANEMKERVQKLLKIDVERLWIGTFHSSGLKILITSCVSLPASSSQILAICKSSRSIL